MTIMFLLLLLLIKRNYINFDLCNFLFPVGGACYLNYKKQPKNNDVLGKKKKKKKRLAQKFCDSDEML